jgi:RNA polymerase sigma-70 factor (ECF subfamily)
MTGPDVNETVLPTRDDDEELVRKCRAGDPEAFAALVDRYKHGIYWLVARMAGREEAEDLTQEVFVRAYQALPRFRGESSFRTWVFKIARNLSLSALRRRGRRPDPVSWEEEGYEQFRLLPEGRPDLEEEIERMDLAERVRALLGRLPDSHRTALTLFYLNQLKYEEIAAVMEVPLGTVKTLIHRGRSRLRDLLVAEMSFAPRRAGDEQEPE